MIRTCNRHCRRGTALITAVVLLLVMATLSATVLSMRTTEVSMDVDAVHRLRADAAALGALQLTARTLHSDADLQAALAVVIDHEGDTWLSGADPLFQVTGELAGVSFVVDVWPRLDEVRLRASAVSNGVHRERWSRLALSHGPKKKKGE